jgi:iron complex outermembrane recepter protein
MLITQVDRRRVSLAAAISMILAGAHVNAQEANKSELEEVVVTGSFIRGTPEDSAMPVEVVSFEEIQNMGRPSNLDLIKTMSESGGVAGEANRVNFYPIGAQTINLRSLGSRFTTVVFNGRRFPEQFSVNTGRFNNVAWIPNAAIGSVETLKAGGGATYGSDAVAGVVNYVTRKNFEGLELTADYRYIEDTDGDYNADMLWGKNFGEAGDMLVSLSYQHRSRLQTKDRDWYRYGYLENPQSYLFVSNPGTLVIQTAPGVTLTPANTPTSQLHMSSTGSFRDVGCREMGGYVGWSATPTPGCYQNTAEMEDLVPEQDMYTLYLEHNVEVSSGLKFHTEALVFRQDIPEISLGSTFGSNPAAWPLTGTGTNGLQTISNANTTPAFYVPGSNPAVANLLNDLRNSDGSLAFTQAQRDAILATGQVALGQSLWRPFGTGGNPINDHQEAHLTMYRVSEAFGGNLPEFWGTSLEWEVGLTYSKVNDVKQAEDILVGSLQAALNGFGGPNCSGTTAGANGCQWFNPFSSAIAGNAYVGGANPYYKAGLANSRELVDWLYTPIEFERIYKNYVVDPIIRGDLGINLPGGPIAIAIGGQYRRQDERILMDAVSDRNNNPCTIVGVTNCATNGQLGPYLFNRQGNVFGAASNNYRPEARHYPVVAGFIETRLPILPTLDLSIAGRYEKFYSDVTNIDNDVAVPAAALKWQPLDWLGVRASWGKTFTQVNPPKDRDAIAGTGATGTKYRGLGGATAGYDTANWANLEVKPEKGDYLDLGLLFNVGNFTANIDFYNITVSDYTRQMTVANVLDAVADHSDPQYSEGGNQANLIDINCSSGALTQPIRSMDNNPLVQLLDAAGNPKPCIQGTTTMQDLVDGTVNYFAAVGQTNSGELKTRGIDFSARYRFDIGAGALTPSIDISRVLKWELSDFVIAGVKVADGYDGLGYLNLGSGRINNSVSKFRANFGLVYTNGGHTVNLQAQYVPPIINDDDTLFASSGTKNANIGDANGITTNGAACTTTSPPTADLGAVPVGAGTGDFGTGVSGGIRGYCAAQNVRTEAGHKVKELLNFDLIYRVELPADTSATLVVANLLDEDPSFYRGIVPYNSAYGSPLGRTFKLGMTKRF